MRNSRFLLLTAGFACLALLGIALGRWQLARADYKLGLRQSMEAAYRRDPLRNEDIQARGLQDIDLHRRVRLQGHWLVEQTRYWDNMPMRNRVGFIVLTPFKLKDQPTVVVVQRGWIARDFQDRTRLQPIETPATEVVLEGTVSRWPSERISLGGGEQGLIRQNPNWSEYHAALGAGLATVSVRETGPASQGLLREWPQPDDGVAMHKGYALQWFLLSALVTAYYVWFQIVKRKQIN